MRVKIDATTQKSLQYIGGISRGVLRRRFDVCEEVTPVIAPPPKLTSGFKKDKITDKPAMRPEILERILKEHIKLSTVHYTPFPPYSGQDHREIWSLVFR